MKVSEAILLGSISTGQAFNELMDNKGNTCAMGAAYVAIGQLEVNGSIIDIGLNVARIIFAKHNWLWLLNDRDCHLCKCLGHPFKGRTLSVIAHINDTHRWTRPQIAEWVSTIEPKDEVVIEQPIIEEVYYEVK